MTDNPSEPKDGKPRYREVLISDIHVPSNDSRYQNIHPKSDKFLDFARGLNDSGMINAPTVVERERIHEEGKRVTHYDLETGQHRLKAWQITGHETIVVQILPNNDPLRTIKENFARFELNHADRAYALAKAVDKLKEKGLGRRACIGLLARELGMSHTLVGLYVRLHERLIPDLFKALAGIGGRALSLQEAVECSGMGEDDQNALWEKWNSTGGREELFEPGEKDLNKRVRPRKELEAMYQILGSRKPVTDLDGNPISQETKHLLLKILRWAMVPNSENPLVYETH